MIPALGASRDPFDDEEFALSGPRILILDDAPPVVRGLRDILLKLGIQREEMVQATTAEEALAHFAQDPPRLVFAELIGVHNEDGLEVILEMLERSPDTKIVLLTAEGRECPEVRAALRAGIFAHIEKPLRHEKIRQIIQEVASEEGGIERIR